MAPRIIPIPLSMPFHLGLVNCYLVQTDSGFVLIDTGPSNQRIALEQALLHAGVQPGNLKLIVITHGDFDHTGNAASLRTKLGAKLAMHACDSGMLEQGDMFYNRKQGSRLLRTLVPLLFSFRKEDRCTPDLWLEDGVSLLEFGLDAKALYLPGHSLGSMGVLAAEGDLFCGDLLTHTGKPAINSIMDDLAAAQSSLARLAALPIQTVYPGHGQPFLMQDFKQI